MYYVYMHYNRQGQCFYIGMGKDKRAYSTASRNDDWWGEALQDDKVIFEIELVATGLTRSQARLYEKSCLKEYGLETLTNRIH